MTEDNEKSYLTITLHKGDVIKFANGLEEHIDQEAIVLMMSVEEFNEFLKR